MPNADAFRVLDHKLRNTAKALKSWSMKNIGSINLQLIIAREIVARLEAAQERRILSVEEVALRKRLKWRCLGLASMSRTIACQRSRMLYLEHGDANTKFFHLQACHRIRKNYIHSQTVDGHVVVNNEHMADALFAHFNGLLGSPAQRSRTVRFDLLNLPTLDLSALDVCFTEDEIWAVVRDIPAEKAPGPDGFTGLFYKKKPGQSSKPTSSPPSTPSVPWTAGTST
ncbi:uncharacterized protein [Miscanthus floridulus]|uniref:uncharacterized protein n=1 Tax=Miscanthus floridulus TaxID=154761 RepID=UPI0034595B5B